MKKDLNGAKYVPYFKKHWTIITALIFEKEVNNLPLFKSLDLRWRSPEA